MSDFACFFLILLFHLFQSYRLGLSAVASAEEPQAPSPKFEPLRPRTRVAKEKAK